MTIEPTEFDLISLARRGLQALLDEAIAERQFARKFATVDVSTRRYTPESKEATSRALDAFGVAHDRLTRFNLLYPERAEA
ncbi:hypothetical protein [Methylorubrum sp. SL192]|uniref:hypothetical protein n=1 Tax=Methylorubrum sp. SL192 TaxID=2995167 RepID=UPI0006F50E2B|nr:hypothetical protein [Methylorubrum sp. SL192]KQO89452.1 hypothetical protein ASF33_19165 [Methylobacterium sp. Leaf92]MCY1644924.1 hypothetical protein [Methylorubrum sp. SL192]